MIRPRVLLVPVLAVLGVSACVHPHAMSTALAAPSCGPRVADRRVDWAQPAEVGDVRGLDGWCASVGPPELEAEPVREPGIASAGSVDPSLTVVTWNVAGREGDLPMFLGDALGYDCTTRRAARDFAILVQEGIRRSETVPDTAFEFSPALPTSDDGRPDLPTVARECGLALLYVPSMRNGAEDHSGGREDRGNAILSTLPLHHAGGIELPFEGQRRVAAVASIVAPETGDTIRLVSIHLDAFAGVARALLGGGASRERQVLGLVDALGLDSEPGDAPRLTTVVAGDLNTWSERQTAITRLAGHFPESPAVDATPTRGDFPTDHIFVRAARRSGATDAGPLLVVRDSYVVLDDDYGSDHRPRLLELGYRSLPATASSR